MKAQSKKLSRQAKQKPNKALVDMLESAQIPFTVRESGCVEVKLEGRELSFDRNGEVECIIQAA